jgi:hypothetical protein
MLTIYRLIYLVTKNQASQKAGNQKSDLLPKAIFIAILKALSNPSMQANFLTNWMIGTVFIGLESSMMAFCDQNQSPWHYFSIFAK